MTQKKLKTIQRISSLFISVTLLAGVVSLHTSTAFATLNTPEYVHSNEYKQLNNIYYYEVGQRCAPGTGIGTAPVTGVEQVDGSEAGVTVYNYLISKGLSPVQALGILGNLMQESGSSSLLLDPAASNGSTIGIAQWLGSRKTALKSYADQQGKPVTDLGVQMDFMWHELTTSYQNSTLTPLLSATTLSQAVDIFLANYERPATPGTTLYAQELAKRLSLAEQAAGQLGVDVTSGSATQPSTTTSPSSSLSVINCSPTTGSQTDTGGTSGSGSGAGQATGENGKLDLSQLAKVTIVCEGSWSLPYLTVEASAALTQLNAAFKKQFGRDLHGISCYRSYEQQVAAKAYWEARGKPEYAATPGTSNHGWGVAIDLQAKPGTKMTYSSEEYKWLMGNAGTYGFCNPVSMRQGGSGPDEPWHWQYKTGC